MIYLLGFFFYPATIILGYVLALCLGVKNIWERIGVGWLLGTALLTYSLFLLHFTFGLQFTALSVSFLVLGLSLLCAAVLYRMNGSWLTSAKAEFQQQLRQLTQLTENRTTLTWLMLLLIPIAFGISLNLHWPVIDWDALALYDYRAIVFARSGGIEDGISRGYFLHYPLYTSLLHTFSYLFNHQAARIWYSLFYISSLFVFYALLRRTGTRNQALVGALLLAISPRIFQHSQMTYTNLPHAMYVALGYIYVWEWWRRGQRLDLVIGILLIGASTWVRLTEPLWIPVYGVLFLGLWRWRSQWRAILICALGLFFVRYPWIHYVQIHDNLSITNPLQIGKGFLLPNNLLAWWQRVAEVTSFFMMSVYPTIKEFVPALGISFLYSIYKEKWQHLWEFLFLSSLLLFLYGGIFLFSFQFEGWHEIPDSAARMAMFLQPLALYLVMKSELWNLPKIINEKRSHG